MLELWKEIYSRLANMVIVVSQISPHVSFLPPLIKERKYWKIRKTKPPSELLQNPRFFWNDSGFGVFIILKERQHAHTHAGPSCFNVHSVKFWSVYSDSKIWPSAESLVSPSFFQTTKCKLYIYIQVVHITHLIFFNVIIPYRQYNFYH